MQQNENTWDKLLKIKTTGRDDSNSDQYHYPYEPTPYCVLERLANSGLIRKNDVVLDYGCGKGRVDFRLQNAEMYKVPSEVNRCYFFNPFSVELLRKVMACIIESYYENPREMLLFFYYPSVEYVGYLMTVDELEYYDEINCEDLFDGIDGREQIMIFQISAHMV